MCIAAIVDTLAVSSKISSNVTDAFFTEKIFTILRLYFSILLECNLNITWIRWPDIYNTLTYVRPTHNWLVGVHAVELEHLESWTNYERKGCSSRTARGSDSFSLCEW